jgi:class 3 adenylate cyclase
MAEHDGAAAAPTPTGTVTFLFSDIEGSARRWDQDRALAIRQHALGPNHPDVAKTLLELALLRTDQGRGDEAVVIFERALAIKERTLTADHPELEEISSAMRAICLHSRGKLEEPR